MSNILPAKIGNLLWGDPATSNLEKRVFNAVVLVGAWSCFLSFCCNLVLHNPMIHIYSSLAGAFINAALYIISRRLKVHFAINRQTIIIFLFLLSVLWFGGGIMGSIPYFFFILLISAAIIIPKPGKKFFVVICFLDIILLSMIEYFFPSLVVPYDSFSQHFFDMLTGIMIALMFVVTIVDIVVSQYVWEKEEREKLLKQAISDKEAIMKAFNEIKQLRGFLPICAACKKIRNDKGYWEQIEQYIHTHTEAEFTHGICPDCAKRLGYI